MRKYYSSTLQKGSKGNEVQEWQKFLNTQGYNLSVDGDFGDKTYAATTDYQSKNGLTVDGVVGENTWGKAGYTPYSATVTSPVTDTTPWDDTEKGQNALGDYNTAKDNLDQYEQFVPSKYEKGEDVLSAEEKLNQHNETKPVYESEWNEKLNTLMNQIMNREKFSYNFNEDPIYQQMLAQFIQQSKMAMEDTIGKASAMTGGYGNSYAQSVGQQAYQENLNGINDFLPELYKMALDRHNMDGQNLLTQYGLIADREEQDYGRYINSLNNWLTDRGYLTDRVDSALNFDYGKHIDEQNMEYTSKENEYKKLLDQLGIAKDNYYGGADMHYTEQENKNSEAWRQKEWDENQKRYEESKTAQENSSGIKINSNGTVDLSSIPGINTTDATWFDKNGNFKGAEYLGTTGDGKASFRIDGKTVTYPIGTNPYTQTVNPDTKHGTFSNGYQPNNVGGKKLSKTGIMDYMNGVQQNVWQTEDGTMYIWDGTQNEYLIYQQ